MEMKRIDMKRHIKPKLIKTFTSLYLGKYCKHHNFSFTYKSFTTHTQTVKYLISLVLWEIWAKELSFSNLKSIMTNGWLMLPLMISSI